MDKPQGITAEFETFQNEVIDRLLEASPNFRRMKAHRRDRYLDEMRRGRWKCGNGETLAIDKRGLLVNGQHRLAAARIYQEEKGEPVWFLVVRGVDRADERFVDQVDPRRFTEYLAAEEVKNAGVVSTIVAAHLRVAAGGANAPLSYVAGGRSVYDSGNKKRRSNMKFSPHEMIDYFRRNRKAIETWASHAVRLNTHELPYASVLAALGYQLARVNSTAAESMFTKLADGAGLAEGDPVLAFRERLRVLRRAHNRPDRMTIIALAVKVWRAWVQGRTLGVLQWKQVGPNAESFPDHRVESA